MIYYIGPEPLIESGNYTWLPDFSLLLECLDKETTIGLDTETTGLDPLVDKVVIISIKIGSHTFVINTLTHSPIEVLNKICSKVLVVIHNASFDYKMIKGTFGVELEDVFDTMLAEQVLNCGKSVEKVNLKNLALKYLNETISKEEQTSFGSSNGYFTDSQILYAAKDAEVAFQIHEKQLELLAKEELLPIMDLENSAVLAFADIEFNGLSVDKEMWLQLSREAERRQEMLVAELDQMVHAHTQLQEFVSKSYQTNMFMSDDEIRKIKIQWSSPLQVLKVFRKLIPSLTGVNSKDDLGNYAKKFPIIGKYIQYKEENKLVSSYGEEFLTKNVRSDGKIHTSFFQILETGRVSSSKPNMQQIPADNIYRNCFVPSRPDYVFVSSDYSSQELCIIAFGSKDPVWLDALGRGEDLHSVCAELIFKDKWLEAADPDCEYYKSKQKCECKAHKKLRNAVKSINFGLAYGMTEHKLSANLDIPLEEAADLIKEYFVTFPKIKAFLQWLGNYAKKNGLIKTYAPYRRKRWFPQWPTNDKTTLGEIERAGKNTPIQGSAADMTKAAMVLIRQEIREKNYPVKLVMVVHDQVDTECEESFAPFWSKRMTELMEEAGKVVITSGLLKADTTISKRWQK